MSSKDEKQGEILATKFEKSHIEFVNPHKKRLLIESEKLQNLIQVISNSNEFIEEIIIKGYQFDDQSLNILSENLKKKKIKIFHIENCNLTSFQSQKLIREVQSVEVVNFSFNKIKNFVLENDNIKEILLNFNPLRNVEIVMAEKLKKVTMRQVELSEKSFIKMSKNLLDCELEELSCTTKNGLQLDSIYYEVVTMIQEMKILKSFSINCKEKVYEKEEIEERLFDALVKNVSLRVFKVNLGLIGKRDKVFQERVEVILQANRFIGMVIKGDQDIDLLDYKIANIVKLKLLNLNIQKDMNSLGLKIHQGQPEKDERSQIESTARDGRSSNSRNGGSKDASQSINLLLDQNKSLMNKIYKLESKMKILLVENQDLKIQLKQNLLAKPEKLNKKPREKEDRVSLTQMSSKKSPNLSSILTKNECDTTNFLSQKQIEPARRSTEHKKRLSESVAQAVKQNMKEEMRNFFKENDSVITRRNSTINSGQYWQNKCCNLMSKTGQNNFFTKENYMRRSKTKRFFSKKLGGKKRAKGISLSRGDCDCSKPKINIIFRTSTKKNKSASKLAKRNKGMGKKSCAREDTIMMANMQKLKKIYDKEVRLRNSCKKMFDEKIFQSLKTCKRKSKSKERDSKMQRRMLKALKQTNKNLNCLLKGGSQRSVKDKISRRKSAKLRREHEKSKIGKIEVKKILENDICEFKHRLEEKLGLLNSPY